MCRLDNIPVSDLDINGKAGMERDQSGVARLKARQEQEAKKAYDKYVWTLEMEERGMDSSALKF